MNPRRIFRTGLSGLVIALLLGACNTGPGSKPEPSVSQDRPVPAWSPPAWLHGTWAVRKVTETMIVKVSRYNVEIDLDARGVSIDLDIASFEQQGSAVVTYRVGFDGELQLRYYTIALSDDTGVVGFTFFNESPTVTSMVASTSTSSVGPVRLVRQDEPTR